MPIVKQVRTASPDLDQTQIARNRMLAQALMQQSQQGVPQEWNSMPVMPKYGIGQGLTTLAQGALSGYLNNKADKQQTEMDDRVRTKNDDLVEALTRAPRPMRRDEAGNDIAGTEVDPINEVSTGRPELSQNGKLLAMVLRDQDPQQARALLAQQALAKMAPKTQEAYSLKPGEARFVGNKKVAEVAQEAKPLDAVAQVKADLTAGRITQDEYDARVKKLNFMAPGPTVNVDTRQESEEAKAVGKAFGEKYVQIQNAGVDASGKLSRLDRMEQLLDGVETGKLTPLGTDIAGYAKGFGFNIDPKLPNKEAAQALSNEMTLQARNPSGGAGMPGAMSDSDRDFLKNMSPNIGQTPEGRAMLIDTSRKLAQRDQEVAALSREYRKKNGKLDEGFYDVLAAHSAANPLFGGKVTDAPKSQLDQAPDGSYIYRPRQ